MWFLRAGCIAAGLALGAALAGCREKRIDVCKAVHGGDAPHLVHLAESPDNGAHPPSRVGAQALPVLTVAADGIYLDHRPLLASWPKARCETFVKTLAPHEQPRVAREQLIVPLDHWKLPARAEADPDAIRPLTQALQWTRQHVEQKMPEQDLTLRIDRDAPFRLVWRVVSSALIAFPDHGGVFPISLAHGVREVSFRGGSGGGVLFGGECDPFLQLIVELHERGASIVACTPRSSTKLDCRCVLDSQKTPADAVLRRILAVDDECRSRPQPVDRLVITAPSDLRWSQLIAENTKLERLGVLAPEPYWLWWPSAPRCGVDALASTQHDLTGMRPYIKFFEMDKPAFEEKVERLRRAATP